MRFGGMVLLLVSAVACGLLSFGALKNLWASYQDSPTAFYLLIGGLSGLLSIALFIVAIRLARRH